MTAEVKNDAVADAEEHCEFGDISNDEESCYNSSSSSSSVGNDCSSAGSLKEAAISSSEGIWEVMTLSCPHLSCHPN